METNEEILKIISNETLDSVHDISIVTPTIYKSIFSKNASSHDADISNEDKIIDSMLNDKISMFQNMQEETSKNAVKLSNHTSKAISAIKEKDEAKLNEILKETQDLRREINKLKEAVYKDELTHSLNRKWLHDNYLQDDSDKFNQDGTLVIIDLNYFKLVNDQYGHLVGDSVLVEFANLLKSSIRAEDVVGRWGGEEFLIICPETNLSEAEVLANKLCQQIGLLDFPHEEQCTASFGVTTSRKKDKEEDAFIRADKALYLAKEEGKNRVKSL